MKTRTGSRPEGDSCPQAVGEKNRVRIPTIHTHLTIHIMAALGRGIELVVADVSFISLRLLLPRLHAVAPAAELLLLVKPQFEVGRGQVGKGGVVRDEGLRAAAVASVRSAAEALGYRLQGQAESRLAGPKGNREVFLRLAPPPADLKGCGSEPR